jgi:23S rRNA (adenine2503-C2)-methyltransferase
MLEKESFYNWTLDELKGRLAGMGKEVYRAQQLMRWVYAENIEDFGLMTNLSKSFREELPGLFSLELPKIVSELKSTIERAPDPLFIIRDRLQHGLLVLLHREAETQTAFGNRRNCWPV